MRCACAAARVKVHPWISPYTLISLTPSWTSSFSILLLVMKRSWKDYYLQLSHMWCTLASAGLGVGTLNDSTSELARFVEELVDRQERERRQQLPRGRPKLQITEGKLHNQL